MQSLKELFKIGNGPSSSHTMGPKRAVEIFKNKYSDATKIKVILYGSLALTGKGHLTDYIIEKTLTGYETEIEFDTKTECTVHPNTFDIFALLISSIIITKFLSDYYSNLCRLVGKIPIYWQNPHILAKSPYIAQYP